MNNFFRILILVNSLLFNTMMGMCIFYKSSECSDKIEVSFKFPQDDPRLKILMLRKHKYNSNLAGATLEAYYPCDGKGLIITHKRLNSKDAIQYFDFYHELLDKNDYLGDYPYVSDDIHLPIKFFREHLKK